MAKWCPLENCTVLVLGSQYGIRLYDWDGSALFYKFDFVENGIGVDERQVTGECFLKLYKHELGEYH